MRVLLKLFARRPPALLAWAALLLAAGAPLLAAAAPRPQPVVLSGHLDHPTAPTVQVSYGDNLLTHAPTNVFPATLDAKGNFRLVVPGLAAPTEARFSAGTYSAMLFLTPGDDLRLTLDAAQFARTLHYTGTGAAANNFMALLGQRVEFDMKNNPTNNLDKSTPAQLANKAAAYHTQQLDFFYAYAATHPVPAVFRAYVRHRVDFQQASYLLYYGSFHASHPHLYPGQGLPASYYGFLVPLRSAQDSALAMHNEWYGNYLRSYPMYMPATEPLPTMAALVASAETQFGTSRSRDLVLAQYLDGLFYSYDATQLAPLMAGFRQVNRDSAVAQVLRARYAKALAVLPGQPAPGFTLLNHEGQPVALADLRGKVVYLDFWGTWCAPCLREMPASLALRKQFAGRDVAFVYIDVDDKAEKWQQVLAAEHLLGPASIHLRSPDDAVPTAYQVEGYPSYWLIGRDGRILNAHAPRPSAGAETVAAIEQALMRPASKR